MLRGIWGDPERFKETNWQKFGTKYFADDGAREYHDGDVWLLGRVDDVMNVSGHHLSTAEIESSLVSNLMVAESAVVGAADETTGQSVVAFVILKTSHVGYMSEADAVALLRKRVSDQIGAIVHPSRIYIVTELPKTRSGKIMRRLLQDVAEGREIGDTQTLTDTTVLQAISAQVRG
jgi:acetyl-CoA synthetase